MASSASHTRFIFKGETTELVFYTQEEESCENPTKAVEYFCDKIGVLVKFTTTKPEKSPDDLRTVNIELDDGSIPSDELINSARSTLKGDNYFSVECSEEQQRSYTGYCPKKISFTAGDGSRAVFEQTECKSDQDINNIIAKLKALKIVKEVSQADDVCTVNLSLQNIQKEMYYKLWKACKENNYVSLTPPKIDEVY
ncbi:hypothetical protein COEREDRAFT_89481 [Coemansia reversa NRRL 1564]|uniref:Uncharacterized protein n=1 Tax=Coemansia reversa (strain ATCC 12441 / NRRL 1564) TaxID=763665 RepID=A0A2G5B488_COERN|nr:hypothetical protein COEREDRAFT_89481 [Coemansia reversa NRRL 1564]|eukprot:PIA13547.1 hypothetical protein COEREDRAFT_89481 [Coemansia reversa NRRL 1564]